MLDTLLSVLGLVLGLSLVAVLGTGILVVVLDD